MELWSFVMKLLFALLLLFSIVFVVSSNTVHAETTHTVKIPTGAGHPGAPYFWSVQNTGNTDGLVNAFPGDTVQWENADTIEHTVHAETLDNSDTLFFSDLIAVGENFSFTFSELGVYEYSCKLHPWMNGVVNVIDDPGNVRTIKNVASGYSDTGIGYNIRYFLDTSLSDNVKINPADKTITFTVLGETNNNEIKIILPEEVISNPNAVWLDGIQTNNFDLGLSHEGTILTIYLDSSPKEIIVMGSHVIPEFGMLALLVLVVSLMSVILLSKKTNLVGFVQN